MNDPEYLVKQIDAIGACYLLRDTSRISTIIKDSREAQSLSLEELDEIAQESLLSGLKWATYNIIEYSKKASSALRSSIKNLTLSHGNLSKPLGELLKVSANDSKSKLSKGTLGYKVRNIGNASKLLTLQDIERAIEDAFKFCNDFNSNANDLIDSLDDIGSCGSKSCIGKSSGVIFNKLKSITKSTKRVSELEGMISSKFVGNSSVTSKLLNVGSWGIEVTYDATKLIVFDGNYSMFKSNTVKACSKPEFNKHIHNLARMESAYSKLVANTKRILVYANKKSLMALHDLEKSPDGTSRLIKAVDSIVYRCSYDAVKSTGDAMEEYARILLKISKLYE